jgi:hypothetical protein
MEFDVFRRREKGLTRPGSLRSTPPERGTLALAEKHCEELNRTSRAASLIGPEGIAVKALPTLLDATLVSAQPRLWTLSGVETVDTNGIACTHGQTWLLVPSCSTFEVYRRRNLGRPRNGTMLNGTPVRGSLVVKEMRSKELRRTTRVAKLVGEDAVDLPGTPHLYDVLLVHAKTDLWTLSGIEIVDTDGELGVHSQTWLMVPADVADLEAAETALRRDLASLRPEIGHASRKRSSR